MRERVEALGAKIDVTSRVGKGTKVTVRCNLFSGKALSRERVQVRLGLLNQSLAYRVGGLAAMPGSMGEFGMLR
jgi:hypothetical protein